ncbi:aminotransferase class I/II-fold pyridoxal phosphate-dependent enzyme [Bacillaceae bacterium IKA-2]|nr:aminotransferase class I/II-fold pyridoxal phosphate-dependent enzyme [Bacillaceae bacterium IKA-2]
MDQNKIPLYEALLAHSEVNSNSFHVPGHKNGAVFSKYGKELYCKLLEIDVTELRGLDDLHYPTGVIKEAQEIAAHLYGSLECFFLIGGSTVGNLAMIMATCQEGDTVLVQRNCHKSILNGLRLAKVDPIFLQPNFDREAQIATCLDETLVLAAIKKYPTAKALIITNPNYYGYTSNLQNIITKAHQYDITVLVDEAHGAHFGHPSTLLPKSAIIEGADIVVQSAHKTLPAMTMGSYLHCNGKLVDVKKLTYYLQLFQSSSPSYPIMASLDLARHFLATISEKEIENTVEAITAFKTYINKIPQLKTVRSEHYQIDPLKVTVQSQCKLTGFQLQELFEEEGIYTELADSCNVLFVMPLVITTNLIFIAEKIKRKLSEFEIIPRYNKLDASFTNKVTRLAMTYPEMNVAEVQLIPLKNSVGRIIAEEIIPYPPGVPILISGEKVEKIHVEYINNLKASGAYFQGVDILETGVKVFT